MSPRLAVLGLLLWVLPTVVGGEERDAPKKAAPDHDAACDVLRQFLIAQAKLPGHPTVPFEVRPGEPAPAKLLAADEKGVRLSAQGLDVNLTWQKLGAEGLWKLCRDLIRTAPADVHEQHLLLALPLGLLSEAGFEKSQVALMEKSPEAAQRVEAARKTQRPAETTAGPARPATQPAAAASEERAEIVQYGITWTFDKPYQVGQFVTGDWWVVGPVTVVKVSPEPGKSAKKGSDASSRYGAAAMKADDRMRNGSMVVEQCSGEQGYDSQLVNYNAKLSVVFPYQLAVDRALISTISNTTNPNPVLLKDIMWSSEATGTAALKAAAVLTCLDKVPPAESFRPPYAGREKPLFSAAKLKWDLLAKLPSVGKPPDWAVVEHWFQRPWLDHIESWVFQYAGPQENQANYGREFCRATSIASLMLMLDVPAATKRSLTLRLVQMGIDNYGLVRAGRRWSADGGHWNGRKWPLLFAGLMLDDKRLTAALSEGLFSEDQQTYFGTGFHGEKALYQIVNHTGPKPPHEEKDPATWNEGDKRGAAYRGTCSPGWPGLALSTLLMNGKATWNHDAFFAYSDRWMAGEDRSLPVPGGSGRVDPFVQAMWDAYRTKTPEQPGGTVQRKWVWGAGGNGDFVIQGK